MTSNKKNEVEYTPFGDIKENAWFWTMRRYGLVALGQFIPLILFIACFFPDTESPILMGIISGGIWLTIWISCLYEGITDYKSLTKEGLIKTFSNSKFISKS